MAVSNGWSVRGRLKDAPPMGGKESPLLFGTLDGDLNLSGLLPLRDFSYRRQVLLNRRPDIFEGFRFYLTL